MQHVVRRLSNLGHVTFRGKRKGLLNVTGFNIIKVTALKLLMKMLKQRALILLEVIGSPTPHCAPYCPRNISKHIHRTAPNDPRANLQSLLLLLLQ